MWQLKQVSDLPSKFGFMSPSAVKNSADTLTQDLECTRVSGVTVDPEILEWYDVLTSITAYLEKQKHSQNAKETPQAQIPTQLQGQPNEQTAQTQGLTSESTCMLDSDSTPMFSQSATFSLSEIPESVYECVEAKESNMQKKKTTRVKSSPNRINSSSWRENILPSLNIRLADVGTCEFLKKRIPSSGHPRQMADQKAL